MPVLSESRALRRAVALRTAVLSAPVPSAAVLSAPVLSAAVLAEPLPARRATPEAARCR
ncbi:hypothetical protein [Streptomyces sp. NPDC051993]|uniref:hypothetical protein n=1 Tax=unclassified Streptomyces TaxID=2593676 RepID=UPI003416A365